jgi:Xaa-Pro dipeptidase
VSGAAGTGVMALEDGARVDFTRLRTQRRHALFAAMDTAGFDVLVLGRPANVRYASGSRQLWRTGANPFAPMCVVVRRTERVHLLASWDDGIPPEIGHDDLYGLFWNPAHLTAALRGIPGLSDARRVGTDALTLFFTRVLTEIAPDHELLDATFVLAEVRRHKTPDELACLQVATSLAEAALAALDEVLRPGVTERALLGVAVETLARLGAPTPASESVVFATGRQGGVRLRYLAGDRPLGQGELIVLSPSALYAGYEGSVGRTRIVGGGGAGSGGAGGAGSGGAGGGSAGARALAQRCRTGMDALLRACGPGRTGADLYRAWESAGEPPPEIALATGVGLGTEPPVVGFGRGAETTLEEGDVLILSSWVSEEGTGGFLEREQVRIGPSGPELMTRSERTEKEPA